MSREERFRARAWLALHTYDIRKVPQLMERGKTQRPEYCAPAPQATRDLHLASDPHLQLLASGAQVAYQRR